MRAVVDIGSNSIKYSLADFTPPQTELEILHAKSWITRLGKGVGSDRILKIEPLKETALALREMKKNFEQHPGIELRVVATSAVRDAKNSFEVHKLVDEILGVPLYVIPGHLEAELSFGGARFAANKIFPDRKSLFVDVGGASTEVGFLDMEELRAKSFQAGGVRCMEALALHTAPISNEDWERAKNEMTRFFPPEELNKLVGKGIPDLGVGIGGSLLAAAEASGAQKLSQFGYLLSRENFENFNEKLRALSLAERESQYHIEKGRSDIICTGILCLTHVMKHFRLKDLVITKWGLRHGVFLNWNHPFFKAP
jgi:exopolyphosphatase/guanosine-5'-triphosphate,3'-diphosphate pyrophosphatase